MHSSRLLAGGEQWRRIQMGFSDVLIFLLSDLDFFFFVLSSIDE